MNPTYLQVEWSEEVASAARTLIDLAIREDLGDQCDWTTTSLVPAGAKGKATLVARKSGIVAGLPVARLVLEAFKADVVLDTEKRDGDKVAAGDTIATLTGSAADLLVAERTMLNFLGRLSGIASLTCRYVDAVAETNAKIYDTRKTTPGWRLLEKYAVHCGGGCNHRLGLDRAVMLKDNHVALAQQEGLTLAAAIEQVRRVVNEKQAKIEALEVEVDRLDQLPEVFAARPDIVLLDNMNVYELAEAVTLRNDTAPAVVLEASGGVNLDTVRAIAESGVDRISVGALTHSVIGLDIGLDWQA